MKHFFYLVHKEVYKHLFDYLMLMTGGILFLIAVNIFRGERLMEFIMLLAFISFYIIWGAYHHLMNNIHHLRIMIEYILIGFTLLFFVKLLLSI